MFAGLLPCLFLPRSSRHGYGLHAAAHSNWCLPTAATFAAVAAAQRFEAAPPAAPAAAEVPAGGAGAFAVSCPAGFGAFRDPRYFEAFGAWQARYGRDNLGLSVQFLEIFQESLTPSLDEALAAGCASYVLEVMMNALLAVETRQGEAAARAWLLEIYRLRALALVGASPEGRARLDQLAAEWDEDVAFVYPKLLGLERFGPQPRQGAEDVVDGGASGSGRADVAASEGDLCMGQRVYVYTLAESLYQPGHIYCLQGQWGTEVVMRHFWKHGNCGVQDPAAADWFFVSLYATCVYVKLNNEGQRNASSEDMDSVSTSRIWEPVLQTLKHSKYYQRRQGRDHIFLFADGQGPRIWDSYDVFRAESIFLSPEAKCPTWGEPTRRYLDVKPCLSTWKDIVIPGHTDYARLRYMQKQNRAQADRRLLLTFHGRAPGAHEAYADCAVRAKVLELGKHGPQADVGGFVEDYPERKGDAHFCLVPAGTSPWTNHLYESFHAGCIPVILSDEYEVAFQSELNWPSFSIKWPEALVGDRLYRHLESLLRDSPGAVAAMKASLERHACWFNWYSMDVACNPYLLIQRRLRQLHGAAQAPRQRFWNCAAANGSALEPGEPPLVFSHLQRPTRFKSDGAAEEGGEAGGGAGGSFAYLEKT